MKAFYLLILALITGLIAYGQSALDTANTGLAKLRFSGENNFGLIPDHVEFHRRDYPQIDTLIKNNQISSNGTLRIRLPKGTYDVSVITKDYESVFTDLEVINNSEIGEIIFSPKSLKPQITYDQMEPFLKDDTVLMDCYVIDDSTRRPLANVLIYTADKVAQSRTDSNGHYFFYVPLPANDSEIKGRNCLYFEKKNYVTEIIYDFDMWSRQIYGRSIYMKNGTGLQRVDEMVDSRRGAVIMTQEMERKNRESLKLKK